MNGVLKFGSSFIGTLHVLTIGLGDNNEVSHLHNSFFDSLQLITGARKHQQEKHVSHIFDSDFGLAYTYRFNQNYFISCCLAKEDCLTRLMSYSTQSVGRGRWTNERHRVCCKL